ncbi:bacteriocin [Chryseobacterium sp. MMS23-Vi53]
MKNLKKLNKKELRSVMGGKEQCIDPMTGQCKKFGIGCAELQCQLLPFD